MKRFSSGFTTNSTELIDQMNARVFRVFSHFYSEIKYPQKGLFETLMPPADFDGNAHRGTR